MVSNQFSWNQFERVLSTAASIQHDTNVSIQSVSYLAYTHFGQVHVSTAAGQELMPCIAAHVSLGRVAEFLNDVSCFLCTRLHIEKHVLQSRPSFLICFLGRQMTKSQPPKALQNIKMKLGSGTQAFRGQTTFRMPAQHHRSGILFFVSIMR